MQTEGLRTEVELTAAKFATRHIQPVAAEADHAPPCFPTEIFARGIEAGFDRFAIPDSMGGHGYQMSELCALIMTLARTCAGHAMTFGIHAAAIKALAEMGTENSVAMSNRIMEARRPVGMTFPEPISTNEIDLSLTVVDENSERIVVNGSAGLALNVSDAGSIVCFAQRRNGDPVAFMADSSNASCALEENEWTLGLRATPMAMLTLKNHTAPRPCVIAEGPKALEFLHSVHGHLCLASAAAAVGLMKEACARAYRYAGERYQGGRTILDHTHLRTILGNMTATATSSEGILFHAASSAEDTRTVLSAKKTVTENAVRVCTDAVQVLGGYGYMRDYGLEKFMRDAAVLALIPFSNPRCELLLAAMEKECL